MKKTTRKTAAATAVLMRMTAEDGQAIAAAVKHIESETGKTITNIYFNAYCDDGVPTWNFNVQFAEPKN